MKGLSFFIKQSILKFSVLLLTLSVSSFVYAETVCTMNAETYQKIVSARPAKNLPAKIAKTSPLMDWLNGPKAYAQNYPLKEAKREQKEQLRQEWEKTVGMDIFYPYFIALDAQDWIESKTQNVLLDFHGKAEVSRGGVRCVLKKKF